MTARPTSRCHPPRVLLASLFAALFLLSAAGHSVAAIYATISGVQGESVTAGYVGAVELSSLQYGAASSVTVTPSGTTFGSPSLSEITTTRLVDSVSPTLFLWLVKNQQIPTITIDFTKTVQGTPKAYLRIVLTKAYVTGQANSSGGDLPTESLSFAYQRISITYFPADSNATPVTATYDLTTGKGS